ncbi:hypothetical protein [Pedobacter sp. B4-66]|uniref:hypothetical protein n=1 Tax=Pedobacter sp. B4-66 TaxID=2817280 RepID=UPI001BD92807|nr:hypothetical protein [Pedobacter sp. B4-66]
MKAVLIILFLFPCMQLFATQNQPTDSVKKTLTAKEFKEMKKQIKKSMPKELANMAIKELEILNPSKRNLTLTASPYSGDMDKYTYDMDLSSLKLDYQLEKQEIIDNFKNDIYDSASDKREARKEMKEDLKELKEDFQRDLKELKKELKENKIL